MSMRFIVALSNIPTSWLPLDRSAAVRLASLMRGSVGIRHGQPGQVRLGEVRSVEYKRRLPGGLQIADRNAVLEANCSAKSMTFCVRHRRRSVASSRQMRNDNISANMYPADVCISLTSQVLSNRIRRQFCARWKVGGVLLSNHDKSPLPH
ncbi:MAG: hypothetical protein PHN51_10915 [Candidatus Nanopelagicales bacterium]|nr:hypothetical protein [Candidatus Nanopelagicales bacterium]